MGETTTNTNDDNQQIIDKIVAFKQQLEVKNTATTFSVEDAIWNMEALANYVFDAPTTEMMDFEYDTLTFTLKKQNATLPFNAVEEMYGSIYKKLNDLAKEKRFIRLIDVALKEETATTVTLTAVPFIGKTTANDKSVFDATDFWSWGLGGGKCGAFSGFSGMDATDVIPRLLVPTSWSLGTCFTSIVTISKDGYDQFFNDNPIANPFGFNNSLVFSRSGSGAAPSPTTCLSPTMLDFYRNNLVTISNLCDTFSTSKTIINYDLASDLSTGLGSWWHFHNVDITYATQTVKRL